MKRSKLLVGGAVALFGGSYLLYKYFMNTPLDVPVVKPFFLHKYLGKWYEIARFDFFHENNIDFATAEYSLNEDGSVKVVNRGYSHKKDKLQEVTGKALFVGEENVGRLKVAFFGSFYSGYNVLAVDKDYKYALVSGNNKKLLWILSREKEMPQEKLEEYLLLADSLGFDISKLVFTKQI